MTDISLRILDSDLPFRIENMPNLQSISFYGSKLERIPREIGQLQSLTHLDIYCSYELHYLPFEVMKCKNLKDSRFSTGALWWSYKDSTGPPTLPDHRYLKTCFLSDAKEVLYSVTFLCPKDDFANFL